MVAEGVVNAIESELDSDAVAVVGHHAGLAQLWLTERQPIECEFVQVGVVGYLPAVLVQRQRLRIRPPHAHVVSSLAGAGEVEVDLHAEFVLRHGQLPEQAVPCPLPGDRSVPEVIGGAEPRVLLPGGGHWGLACSSVRA